MNYYKASENKDSSVFQSYFCCCGKLPSHDLLQLIIPYYSLGCHRNGNFNNWSHHSLGQDQRE